MKNYEKPEINVTSYEATDNMMVTASSGAQSNIESIKFSDINF